MTTTPDAYSSGPVPAGPASPVPPPPGQPDFAAPGPTSPGTAVPTGAPSPAPAAPPPFTVPTAAPTPPPAAAAPPAPAVSYPPSPYAAQYSANPQAPYGYPDPNVTGPIPNATGPVPNVTGPVPGAYPPGYAPVTAPPPQPAGPPFGQRLQSRLADGPTWVTALRWVGVAGFVIGVLGGLIGFIWAAQGGFSIYGAELLQGFSKFVFSVGALLGGVLLGVFFLASSLVVANLGADVAALKKATEAEPDAD